ncbi:hypothetical protein BROOK1789B_1017 [Bathymodiolus brooksi thiotrophic gill symbiont]|nr:hypothetical protein BROOK1789B_1017 [Bathymodiolus brooksi thiotrophic gill symbiont]
MKKIIKHYPMTDRLIVRRGYNQSHVSCVFGRDLQCKIFV